MVYISFIFSLPYKTPSWLVVLLGFLMGLTMDFFTGVLGLHALATLIIAVMRPLIIRIISKQMKKEKHLRPIFYDMKFIWYIQYVFLLTLIHHLVYFFADIASFHNIRWTMIVILANTGCSIACIFMIQLLFFKPSKRY
jgi:cell shape-determining protein MreD